jgi:hypothetical protein
MIFSRANFLQANLLQGQFSPGSGRRRRAFRVAARGAALEAGFGAIEIVAFRPDRWRARCEMTA